MKKNGHRVFRWLHQHRSLVGLLVFVGIVTLLNPNFLSARNILNVLRQVSVNFVLAIGMTFVIISGGIDLSVGSLLAFTGAIFAHSLSSGQYFVLAILIVLLTGALAGIASGALISYCRLQPFILTLIAMTLFRGLTLLFTEGKPITIAAENALLDYLGSGNFLGIPIPIYIMAAVFGISHYILHHTRQGRYIYALGGNEEAAYLSGINIHHTRIFVYGMSGLLSALGAIILTSRLFSAQPTAGTGYELDAIAAVVLGGTSLVGGVGRVSGTLQGVLILGLLGNALNILNVSSYYQMVIKALVILIAVLSDRISKNSE